jgi:hypothetical protein
MLASGSQDGKVRFWDAVTGKLARTIEFDGEIQSLVFSPDGRTLAVAQRPNQRSQSYTPGTAGLQRLNTSTGSYLPRLESIPGATRSAAFSSDGKRIVTGSASNAFAAIWDSASGKELKTLPRALGVGARAFAFSPDGTRLAISYDDNVLTLWHADTAESIVELDRKPAVQLQFSPDGSRLYANSYDAIRVYDTRATVPAEAEELVRLLRKQFPLYCDMRQFLERDAKLDPALRELALRMIEGQPEEKSLVYTLIRNVLDFPGADESSYQAALGRARMIVEPRPWDVESLVMFGAAQYRTGDYTGSITTLERAAQLQGGFEPRMRIFTAMAQHRLGLPAQAGEHLAAARTQISGLFLGEEQIAPMRALLREAETLITPRK